MIDDRGEPVVTDFGLARRRAEGGPQLTVQGEVMGTPAYMPPEQGNDYVLRVAGNDAPSARISRRHFEVHRTPAGFAVVDRSKAGLTRNGVPLPKDVPVELADGDRLGVAGVVTLEVSIRPAGQGTLVLFRPANLGAADWRPYVSGFLLAGLSILNSVFAQKPRDAIVLTYLAVVAYLALSLLSLVPLQRLWVVATSPVLALTPQQKIVMGLMQAFDAGNPIIAMSE